MPLPSAAPSTGSWPDAHALQHACFFMKYFFTNSALRSIIGYTAVGVVAHAPLCALLPLSIFNSAKKDLNFEPIAR
jgi:hypothetical protein